MDGRVTLRTDAELERPLETQSEQLVFPMRSLGDGNLCIKLAHYTFCSRINYRKLTINNILNQKLWMFLRYSLHSTFIKHILLF